MAFFTSFDVNVVSLIFYLILFGIVLYGIQRFLFQRVLRLIDARQAKINQSLDEAQEAVASVKANQAKAEKTIDEAAAEAREIINRAERLATEVHEDARKEAKVQAELIVVKAREEINRERQAAVNELRRQAVDLALTAAGRVIGENLSDDKSRQLAEEAVKQAELRA
jgi:F-type H+-transporting ATPase subunit b